MSFNLKLKTALAMTGILAGMPLESFLHRLLSTCPWWVEPVLSLLTLTLGAVLIYLLEHRNNRNKPATPEINGQLQPSLVIKNEKTITVKEERAIRLVQPYYE